jgi:hypothetical protein
MWNNWRNELGPNTSSMSRTNRKQKVDRNCWADEEMEDVIHLGPDSNYDGKDMLRECQSSLNRRSSFYWHELPQQDSKCFPQPVQCCTVPLGNSVWQLTSCSYVWYCLQQAGLLKAVFCISYSIVWFSLTDTAEKLNRYLLLDEIIQIPF